MKTYISQFVNREYEQLIINLIGSFTAFRTGCFRTQMQIFIRKNRDIGAMYVQQFWNDMPNCRSRYDKLKWRYPQHMDIRSALFHLHAFQTHSHHAGVPVDIKPLVNDLVEECLQLHLY